MITPFWIRTALCLAAALLVSACAGDGPTGTEPPPPPPDTTGNGNVQRAVLTVSVKAEATDQPVTSELGWSGGAVPQALVVLTRLGSSSSDTVLTGSDGTARFEDLLEGNYEVTVLRLLDSSEAAGLTGPNAGVNAFGGGKVFAVSPPATTVEVPATAGRRGSLVFSELAFFEIWYPAISRTYDYNGFLEVYNNSDSTIYLDGKLVGSGWSRSVNAGPYPCTDYMDFLQDAHGIWADIIYRFPGTGTQYPLLPGRTAVLATDAIDHRQFIAEGRDLSRADFEFIGRGDVDNPAVPDLQTVGPHVDIVDHGRIFRAIDGVLFLADPVDIEALPRRRASIPPTDPEYVRIPGSALIEVASYLWRGGEYASCDQLVHTDFDRRTLGYQDASAFGYWELSFQRPVLGNLPNGQEILQRTRTSSRDFSKQPATPGALP